jgi:hypothetical protein
LLLAGCAPSTYPDAADVGGDAPRPTESAPMPTAPAPAPTWAEDVPEPTMPELEPPIAAWTCYYEPTFNYDWHDDALCSNGAELLRPYLREWDDYVTEDELMESALEYEWQLNGG